MFFLCADDVNADKRNNNMQRFVYRSIILCVSLNILFDILLFKKSGRIREIMNIIFMQ